MSLDEDSRAKERDLAIAHLQDTVRFWTRIPRDQLASVAHAVRGRIHSDYDRVPAPPPDAPKAVFLWLPKTAGSSLFRLLSAKGCRLYHQPHRIRNDFANRGMVSFGHYSYAALIQQCTVTSRFDADSFKFCVVRNPFDRAVSLYFYLRTQARIPVRSDFLEFTRQLREARFPPVGLYNLRGASQCNPQVSWLVNNEGDWLPDLVGRFEDLPTFVENLGEALGMSLGDLPRINSSPRARGYRHLYSDEARRNVEIAYAADLERFDYDF